MKPDRPTWLFRGQEKGSIAVLGFLRLALKEVTDEGTSVTLEEVTMDDEEPREISLPLDPACNSKLEELRAAGKNEDHMKALDFITINGPLCGSLKLSIIKIKQEKGKEKALLFTRRTSKRQPSQPIGCWLRKNHGVCMNSHERGTFSFKDSWTPRVQNYQGIHHERRKKKVPRPHDSLRQWPKKKRVMGSQL